MFERFTEDTLHHFAAKFCKLYPLDETILYNKLVIPIIKNGKTIGVALRDTTGKFIPKWLYQPSGLQINSLLYNFDNILDMYGNNEISEVILVEGIFDVWAYYEIGVTNVIAIFGSSLKEEQYKMLLKLPLNITLSFDNDDAGKKCTKEVMKKFKNKSEIKVIDLPVGYDPADCTKEQLLSAYLNRT